MKQASYGQFGKQRQKPSRDTSEFPLCIDVLTEKIGYFNFTNVLLKHLRHFWSSLRARICFADSRVSVPYENSQFSGTDSKEDGESTMIRECVEIVMERLGLHCIKDEEFEGVFDINDEVLDTIFEDNEPSLEEIKGAFCVFDVNKEGFIVAEELQRVLCVLGLNEGRRINDCKSMIRNFDRNGDGRIDFQKFVKFMEDSFC